VANIENTTITIKPIFEFETNAEVILNFLKEHYKVPDAVTGFTLICEMDDVVRIEWRTLLTKKDEQ